MFLNVPDIIHIVIMLKSPTVHYLELLFIVNYADWISFTILGNLCIRKSLFVSYTHSMLFSFQLQNSMPYLHCD